MRLLKHAFNVAEVAVTAMPEDHGLTTTLSTASRSPSRFLRMTDPCLRRGVHRSVRALEAAIDEFIAAHNAGGLPFVWTKTADEILTSIARFARRTLNLTQAPELMS